MPLKLKKRGEIWHYTAPLLGGDYEALRKLRRRQKPSGSPMRLNPESFKAVAIPVRS